MAETFLSREKRLICQPGLTYPFIEESSAVFDEVRAPYWNQGTSGSRIAIFGDCNLQAYQEIGGGIAANLAYDLQYPVYNAGRFLPFHSIDPVTNDFLEKICEKDLVIYTAFISASFVRSSKISLEGIIRNRRIRNTWSTLDLDKM